MQPLLERLHDLLERSDVPDLQQPLQQHEHDVRTQRQHVSDVLEPLLEYDDNVRAVRKHRDHALQPVFAHEHDVQFAERQFIHDLLQPVLQLDFDVWFERLSAALLLRSVHGYGAMLLKNITRASVMPVAFILLSLLYAGCSGQDINYASSPETAAPASAQPTPQPTPNADQAAGLITRFYRDIDTNTKNSVKDLSTIVSGDFFRNHHDDLIADYAYIRNPKVQIREVHERTVSYTLDYIYLTKAGRLFWERSGRWNLNHGAQSGWVLDSDVWDSVHLLGISTSEHPAMVPVQDTVYSDGRHEFTYIGERLSFFAKGDDWHITVVPTPEPAFDPNTPVAQADTSTAGSQATSDTTAADNATTSTQTHFDDPQAAQAKCPSDIVVWVNLRSGIFHMPGTRWYGATINGTFECEGDAFAEGDRQSRNGQ